ncbi:MAG TPA: hypothetical protein VK509_11425 [Polyangiales bacterium]|nr:hypothetical protein [Polyangiales bacterium]
MSADRPSWLKPDAAIDRRLADLIDAGRSEQPSALQLDALGERLAQTFGGPGPGGTGAGASSAGATVAAVGTVLPWGPLLTAGLIAVAAASAWWLQRPADHAVLQPAASPAHAPDAVPSATPTAVPAGEPAAPPVPASAVDAGTDVPRAKRLQRNPAPAPAPPDLALELRLLDAAERSLASDPARSLAMIEHQARRFPAGQLVQERELIAIEALVRLGQRARAEARAQHFLAQHPDSTHARRVRTLLASAAKRVVEPAAKPVAGPAPAKNAAGQPR